MAKHLLQVTNLQTSFDIPAGEVRSVQGVTFNVEKGHILGIIGESGSGKSVTASSIMQILVKPGRIAGGSVLFEGSELIGMTDKELRVLRGYKIAQIFQDPMTALNPVFTIEHQMREALFLHDRHPVDVHSREEEEKWATEDIARLALIAEQKEHPEKDLSKEIAEATEKTAAAKKAYLDRRAILKADYRKRRREALQEKRELAKSLAKREITRKEFAEKIEQINRRFFLTRKWARERCIEMLRLVGVNEPEKRLKQYPFEFSGGMLQRVMIAMALLCNPDLLIADEPTTALDVTIQAQILELIKNIQKKLGMGVLIITHDLGVVAQVCDEVDVMYAGRIVERGTVDSIFYNPQHEYTKGLIASMPGANAKKGELLHSIEGNPVDVFALPKGCSFAPRCEKCMEHCLHYYPKERKISDNQLVSCFYSAYQAYQRGEMTKEEIDEYFQSGFEIDTNNRKLTKKQIKASTKGGK